jgi:signal transduction histidine kinase/ligand-binding sensor domain-containing protein/AraC-like DNA-binding protein/ActR/RegA family two-component response regulator
MKLSLLLFYLFLSGYATGFCQWNNYRFSNLDIKNGLSNNQVNCIYKDQKGFLWIGTSAGLNRYDGYRFTVFKRNDLDTSTLVDDNIHSLYEGPKGDLWVQTQADLNIYDPATGKVNRHPDYFFKASGLPATGFNSIVHIKDTYYFVYADSGVYSYRSGKNALCLSATTNNGGKDNAICDAVPDAKGYLWLIRYNGMLEQLDIARNRIVLRTDIQQGHPIRPPIFHYSIFVDNQDEIWLYQPGALTGLYKYEPATRSIFHFSKGGEKAKLSSNFVNGIIQDDKGLIWIITDHGGITIINKKTLSCKYLTSGNQDSKSIPENTIDAIYKDGIGHVWLGTFKKGLSYYDENKTNFPLYHAEYNNPNSLAYDDVNGFAEDKKGNLWIGANGGGLIYFDRQKNKFTSYTHDSRDPNSLCSDIVIGLCLDHTGKLWIGTYFGGLDCFEDGKFTHYRHSDSIPTSLSDDRVYRIMEDREYNLWVGTLHGGLDRFDREKNIFYHNRAAIAGSIHSSDITSLLEDRDGNLWIGTTWGVDKLDKGTGKFVHYIDDNSKLSFNNVNDVCEDHAGNIWVSTRHGLNVLPKGDTSFTSFFSRDGLPDDYTLEILEDTGRNLWVSTKNGLAKIRSLLDTNGKIGIRCTNYDEDEGLQGREFNNFASWKTRDGELVFGGPGGFNLFNPATIKSNQYAPPLVLTNFQLFNRNMTAGELFNHHIILPVSISESRQIVLRYNENDFSLEFAALSFTNATKNKYLYKLEGFNKDWVIADGRNRSATYTNLDPGNYIFHVKGSNSDAVWNENGLDVKITILPPFWKTPWAYTVYVLLLIITLYLARRAVIRRARTRFMLEAERGEARRMHELDMMKIKFFTNLSHEFRTPLSLILAPVDKLIKNTADADQQKQGRLIERNAKRLLYLVNQLLDFRKMGVNELKLNMGPGDVARFIKETAFSFTDLAEEKNIVFTYQSETDHLVALFDRDKVERILFNLLSNAFKFTPERGTVSVEFAVAEKEEGSVLLELKVKDTGIGIPPEMHQKIFETFFQNELPAHILNQGSGIGLAITREFVEMHGGSIKVDSEPDKGSCFTVLLPLALPPASSADISCLPADSSRPSAASSCLPADSSLSASASLTPLIPSGNPLVYSESPLSATDSPAAGEFPPKRLTVLLVEDNEDFRFYLKDNLSRFFTILEASNGKEGWQKSLSAHPDLVVSDISMPVMDGLELCRKIRSDPRTQHIPVILLTALAAEQDQLRALGTGANDFITKPFNFEILVSRIKNLLDFKESVKKTYKKMVEINPGEIGMDSGDDEEDFVREAVAVIEKNLANPDFSVEDWSRALRLSRTSLYKRIVTRTGKTPIEFIRSFRLKRAAQLLGKTRYNITEVAYMVGFNNPKYFARYFKEEFNMLPSAYQAEKRRKPDNLPE